MMKLKCEEVDELLVDYADRELAVPERDAVTEHLDSCATCREELALLSQSLEYARDIWQDSLADIPHRDRPHKLRSGWTLAIGVVVMTLAGVAWFAQREEPDAQRADQGEPVGRQVADSATDLVEVKNLIAQEARSARLSMSAELLSTQPSLANHARRANQYVSSTFADSAAGKRAQQRLLRSSPKRRP